MTHAESQDLLVDLACGELDAVRAAEIERHLAECAECREEKAALDEARRLSAPLRELEEPPPGFDDRILEAARAEASLQHGGNVGEVIEVSGNVRPLGVEAARIDAHAPVKVRPAERHRPRWMVRVALGGSVAAAAALALVVGTTLETRREAARATRASPDEYRIKVQPAAPEAVTTALRDAEEKREAAPPQQAAPAQERALKKKEDVPVQLHGAAPDAAGRKDRGAGGSAPPLRTTAPSGTPAAGSVGSVAEAQKAPAKAARAREEAAAKPEAESGASLDRMQAANQRAESATTAQPRSAAAAPSAVAKPAAAPDAQSIEADAQQARHSADYVLAASLYRSAAVARGRNDEKEAAAWNLAHAVECLAAVGRFDEARQVREELARSYPTEATALSAARRALREIDAPASRQ